MLNIYARDPERQKFYRLRLTPTQAGRIDNGMLISVGLTVGEDIARSTITRWVGLGIGVEVSEETWKHSGCQSGCTLRGDEKCVW